MENTNGFSLLELLVALAIVAVLVGIGAPAMRETTQNARRTATLNGLVRAVHVARAEAVRTGREVVLCARSEHGLGCQTRTGNGGADWSAGWLVFVNDDRDRPAVRDALEAVLLEQGPATGADVVGNRGEFRFLPFNRRSTNGTLVYCDQRGSAAARALIVSYTGRPRLSDSDASGRPVSCHG